MILRERTGTVYEELTTTRYVKGVGRVLKRRWVGEITINRKRYRCRSTNRGNVEAFVRDMAQKAGPIIFKRGMSSKTPYYTTEEYEQIKKKKAEKASKGEPTIIVVTKNEKFAVILAEQSERLRAFRETEREEKRQERAQYWKERAKRLFPYGHGERYLHSFIPHRAFRVLRSVEGSDRIALHVRDARKLQVNNYNLWRIEHDSKDGKTYMVLSEKNGQIFGVYDSYATLFSNKATDKLDGLWNTTLAHGQLLDIVSWEKRGNELWFEIKAGKICKK